MKFAIIGEGVIDRFISNDSYVDVVGGSGLNTAIATRFAGLDADWVTLISKDRPGKTIADYASERGVFPRNTPQISNPTPLVEISLKADGSPNYSFQLDNACDWQWTLESLQVLNTYDVVHLTSLSGVLQPGADALYEFLSSRKPSLLFTYDPNARPSALKPHEESFAKSRIVELVRLANIVKVSEEDLHWISPMSANESAARWSTLGPTFVVLTRGEEGVSLFIDGQLIAEIAGVHTQVIDTVGAGDTIMAWILHTIEKEGTLPSPTALVSGLKLAVKAAAITCSRQGCKPPKASEVLES